jgi:hypothetical protein
MPADVGPTEPAPPEVWGGLSPRVVDGPGQGVVGDLLPALLGGQQVGVAGLFLDLGHGAGLVVVGVGPLDRWTLGA